MFVVRCVLSVVRCKLCVVISLGVFSVLFVARWSLRVACGLLCAVWCVSSVVCGFVVCCLIVVTCCV